MDYSIDISDVEDQAVFQGIVGPLVDYNNSQAGPGAHKPLVIAIRDAAGAVTGGLWGATGYEWLFVRLLVVPESLRGTGVGSEVMRRAEVEALARGCTGVWLDTFEFQARGFYEKLGYECFGQLPDYPKGYSRYFMKKSLKN